jgi:pseudolysin
MEYAMHKHHRKLVASGVALLSVSLACMTSVWAAQPINLQNQSVAVLQSFSAESSFQQTNSAVDFNNTLHVRFQETYHGYPVWTGDAVMHMPKGASLNGANALHAMMQKTKGSQVTMNGVIYQGLTADLASTPAYVFTDAQANKALQIATESYQKKSGVKSSVIQSKSNLMVYVDENNKAHWAFLVSFKTAPSNGLPEKPTYIMDGTSFEIYKEWNNIQTLDNEEGGGFGGNEKMGKLVYDNLQGDLPELEIARDAASKMCLLENSDVTVKDRRHNDAVVQFACEKPSDEHNKIYWDADQDAVNGGYSPSNDALYAGKVIKEMYQKWYNVPVLTENGKPMMLNMRVHENMDNAYWDGREMTFGDGISMFYPLVSLGVAAHEISHGFTEQHSGLIYSGQSGGLNEAYSDMAAQAAEFYSVGHNSWQIGPEIFKAANQALRYMDEPTKDGRSISNLKDYKKWLDVHYTSGIFNKLFYLLGTTKGWDTKKAFDVMVHANASYWTSGTSFHDAACGVMKSAADHQYDVAAVSNAAAGVGITTSDCASGSAPQQDPQQDPQQVKPIRA